MKRKDLFPPPNTKNHKPKIKDKTNMNEAQVDNLEVFNKNMQ